MHPYFIVLACVTQILPLQPAKVSHAMDSLHCLDWQNKPVADGEKYVPNKDDPCMTCTCSKGYRIMCTSVACSPPGNCALWKQIDGVCCEYQCIMSGEGNDVQGGNTNFNSTHPDHNGGTSTDDESITNLGLRLVASTVTSFLVLALLLFMVHRLRQRRLLMAMRRFEAQARLQQLEETDSDHYIPETFLGIECPPYEDPPPPYSPPKPHPRILPGEAPPPYEEIDQNPLSPLNNNEINRVITEENRAPNPRQCHVAPSATNNPQTDASNGCVQTSAVPNVECRIENEEMRRSHNPGEGSHHGGVCVLPDFNGLMHTYISGNLNMSGQSNRSRNSYLPNNDCVSQSSPVRDAPLLSSSVHSELRNEADCSCDEEQTMLKRCYSPERENNQSLSPRQHSPLLKSTTPSSNRCENHPTATSDVQTTMSVSMTEASNQNRNANQYSRFASLPRQLRSCTTDYQRASTLFPPRVSGETMQGIPLVDLKKTLSSEQTDAGNASTSGATDPTPQSGLRSAADGSSRQDLLRGTLKPLTLSDKVTPLCSNILVPNHGQASVQSSEARLRNLRLSNLMNSPTKQMDGSTSPVTPDGQPIKRSQSVTSEISIFSVCSETGEVRLPKPVGSFLRNDSQYPEVPLRASQTGQPSCSVSRNPSSEANNAPRVETSDNMVTETPRPLLQAITEDQVGNGNVGGPIGASALIQNFNKLNKELKEKSKKKEKCKVNRHSTGSLPAQKQKKVRQSCLEAGPSSESKQGENSGKKYDGSRRKAAKQSGLFKQYGFIDDNSACPLKTSGGGKIEGAKESRKSESKEHSRSKRDGENCRNKVDVSQHCDSTVLQVTPEVAARNARQSSLRPGVKRQLNYSEKTHSPSPTRHKSRPKSMFPSCSNGTGSGSKDVEVTTWNDLSKDSSATCVPKRKSKSSSSSRNKKRQSHPASNMQCAENTGIVLSRPNILASVADMTNETVYPVAELQPETTNNRNATLLNGYVYKYNTDTKSQDNGNVYVKLRPTSLSSYV